MFERSPDSSRIDIRPGDDLVSVVLDLLRRLGTEASVTVASSDKVRTFSMEDIETWVATLRARGGEAKLFTPGIMDVIHRAFPTAQRRDPSLALAVATVDIPPGTAALTIIKKMIDAIRFKTGGMYAEGNAVTATIGGTERFYLTDLEISTWLREKLA